VARGAKRSENGGLSRIQERNRAKIIEAALTEFARFGFGGATVEKISLSAGMSKSNLLYYFASKDEMYEAVIAHILEVWLAPLRTLDLEGDPEEELSAYIHQKMRISAERPDASKLFANEVMQGAPRIKSVLEGGLRDLVEEKAQVIRSWIEAGKIREIDPVHLIFTIWATTQHYADFDTQIRAITGHDLSDKTFRHGAEETVTRLLLHGLLPDKAS